ncbi:hypothetical protein [Chryseobacterium sp. MP_3.2]|uniref:hypothetical protein n=1 Tax=Chryseobacterium sp. MP_3.2 TaxID=3071712 RepID=UPI002DFE7840|nr:hypothetical protein [Chryseobacterium sp. MP_3.2]
MKNNIVRTLIIVIFLVLIVAYLSSKAISIIQQTQAYDNFIPADPSEELPFEKLVGKYELDANSKKRYNIPYKINLALEIEKDTTLVTEKYINPFNRKIEKL